MNDMNYTGATLVAHCGARKVSRDELKEFPIPEATRTHQPLSHFEIVEVLEEALSFRYLKVVRDEYAVSSDGMKMFGVMDLNSEFNGGRFSIGLRNSNDKSMRLALTAGVRIFVCDNMAFSGDFTPLLHKHTRNLDLSDSISIAVDRIHRGFEPLKRNIEMMRQQVLTEHEVKLIIYEAFLDRSIRGLPRHLLPLVHENYFHPRHEAFFPRNLWSLSNAFTSAFKKLVPLKQFEVTARLGTYLSEVQKNLTEKVELHLKLKHEEREAQMQELSAMIGMNSINGISQTNERATQIESGERLLPIPPNRLLPPQPKDFGYEDFDAEDAPEDPYDNEVFDSYFDAEETEEEIDEATERLIEEFENKIARAA